MPEQWISDTVHFDGTAAWKAGDFDELFGGADMHYRGKWYVQRGARPLICGVGVFGQNVFVDPVNDVVIAKCLSQPMPLDAGFLRMTLAAAEQIRTVLG